MDMPDSPRGWAVCSTRRVPARAGMTLVETIVSLMLACLLLGTIYIGVTRATEGSMMTAQRVSAFGLCRDRYEQMRGGDFSAITASNYPTATVTLTYLGGLTRQPITGTISNTITVLAAPSRRQVRVFVAWNFRGRAFSEYVSGVIVDRASTISVIGSLSGTVILNPSTSAPALFAITLPNSTQIGLANLVSGFSYSGDATHVRYKAGGSGIQTSLLLNFQPYPMSNAKQWDMDSASMTVALQQNATSGKWSLTIDGIDTVISCQ